MKPIATFILLISLSLALQAQDQAATKDSLILKRFFHAVGHGFKKANQCAKKTVDNAVLKYHDSPHHIGAIDKRFAISLYTGINYLTDLGPKNFPLDTTIEGREINSGSSSNLGIHTSYTFIPGWGFHGGIVLTLRITKSLSVDGGLQYFSGNSICNYSTDTNEINALSSFYLYEPYKEMYFKKWQRNYHNIQIPFYFCYSHKRFSIMGGTKIMLVSITNSRKTLLNNTIQKSNSTKHPFFKGSHVLDYSTPSLKIKYQLTGKKIPVSIYVCIDWLSKKQWETFAGLQVGVFSK